MYRCAGFLAEDDGEESFCLVFGRRETVLRQDTCNTRDAGADEARGLEKNGFRLEDTKVGAVVKGGKAMDVITYFRMSTTQ